MYVHLVTSEIKGTLPLQLVDSRQDELISWVGRCMQYTSRKPMHPQTQQIFFGWVDESADSNY